MREIKFRAWNKRFDKYEDPKNISINILDGKIIDRDSNLSNEDFILEQFTGLTDKNGTDIYENDKVTNKNGKEREVGYNERRCQFALYCRQIDCWITNELLDDTWEVVGHIHE